MVSKVQLVVNPVAGNGRSLGIARRLETALTARGHRTRSLVPRSLGALARWARECEPDFAYLCCVGGDDTMDAVAPACIRLGVPLVPVPVGFGNVFARATGHRARVGDVLRLLEGGTVHWVDVGIGRHGVFVVARGFGFLEDVQQAVETAGNVPRSAPLRCLAYVRQALRAVRHMPLHRLRVEIDGERLADDAAMVIVANVPTYDGFVNLTPQASPLDGLLDVFLVHRTTPARLFWELVGTLLRPRAGKAIGGLRRATRVSIQSGEEAPEEFFVVPRALPVLGPAAWAGRWPPPSAERSLAWVPTGSGAPGPPWRSRSMSFSTSSSRAWG